MREWPKKGSHSWTKLCGGAWDGWFRCAECGAMQPPWDEGDDRDAWDDENTEETCAFRQAKKIHES